MRSGAASPTDVLVAEQCGDSWSRAQERARQRSGAGCCSPAWRPRAILSLRLGAARAWLLAVLGIMLALCPTSTSLAQQGTSHFDHFKTGFPLMGSHMTVDCVSCHINGRLQGTPRACAACHNGTIAPGTPANHIPTWIPTCDTCHRNSVTFAYTPMNHTGISSGCTTCHNGQAFFGVTPVSKPANRIATTADCVS